MRAVQLNYSAAHAGLQQAIRRAPPAKTAPGFYQAVHKLYVIVELLMGDIPDRGLFRHPVLEKSLAAYFDIVKGKLDALFCAYPILTSFQPSERAPSLPSSPPSPPTPPNSRPTEPKPSSSGCART